jgi:hypothetical protein
VANIAATSVSTVPCPAVHPYPETHRNTGWSQNHDMQNVLQNPVATIKSIIFNKRFEFIMIQKAQDTSMEGVSCYI